MQREPRLLRLSWPNSDAGLSERKDWQGQSIAVRERCWYFGNTLSCMELRTGLEKEWGLHSRGFVAGRKKWNLYLGSGLPDHLGIHIETILQIPSINGRTRSSLVMSLENFERLWSLLRFGSTRGCRNSCRTSLSENTTLNLNFFY